MSGIDRKTSPQGAARTPRRWRTWPFRLWLANIVVGCCVGLAWLGHAPPETTLSGRLFSLTALVSTVSILSLPPQLALWLLALRLPTGVARWLCATVWTAFQLALYADTRVYDIFRYHINGMVWNLLTAPDMGDSVQLSASDWAIIVLGIATLLFLQLRLSAWLARLDHRRPAGAAPRPAILRPRWAVGMILVPIVLTEKTMYAYADLNRDLQVTALEGLYPVYLPLTIKSLAETYFDVDLRRRPRVSLPSRGLLLDYPKEPIAAPLDGPRPNLLVLVVDSLREDMLQEETMPRLTHFAERARVLTDHASGGNATRFGLFSMIYGLHGPYWHPIYAEKRSPVLVDVLLDAGYAMHVFSTASMYSPEFRSTAWVRMEESVTDKYRAETKAQKDVLVGEDLLDWIGALQEDPEERPFFAFVLLDSPHQAYSFPTDDPPFEPWVGKVDYLQLSGNPDPDLLAQLWNSYRNAVHHADSVVGDILSGLEELGVLDETLLVVTGDHGEEFGENGFWGHTSNFTPAQVRVPCVIAGPGIEPGTESRPTSHLDLPATLLEALGVDPALRPLYTLGSSLLDPDGQAPRVVSGWDTMGLWTDEGIVTVPIRLHRGFSRVYTYDWKVAQDEDEALRRTSRALVQLVRECGRFLR